MFWEIFITILLCLWIARYVAGSIYGVYLMYKTHPSIWDWQTQLIAGLPFWIGYYIGTGLKVLRRKLWKFKQ